MLAISAAPAAAASAALRTASILGRTAARHLWAQFGQQVAPSAASNLKLFGALLLTGTGFTALLMIVPVTALTLALSVGLKTGRPIVPPAPPPAQSPPLETGQLACPLPGSVVTQPFGPSSLPGEPALFGYRNFHAGVDLAMPEGTAVRAAESGQVVWAGAQTNSLGMTVGYGNHVRIAASGDRVDYYGHLSRIGVSRGDVVQRFQVIGWVGSTGYSTGPHLHFEVRVMGKPVDPVPYMPKC